LFVTIESKHGGRRADKQGDEMKVVITGAAGFLGRRLAARLLREGSLTRSDGWREAIERLVLFDMVQSETPADVGSVRVETVAGDITDPSQVQQVIGGDTDGVFHLAAVVSGACEADFDLGMRVNVDGTRNVYEACRASGRKPRLVFTSSLAVYGGEAVVDDRTPALAMNSYGTQKTVCEQLLVDYTRKGFLDGRALRLPTISVRPGKPNAAASSFVSGIIREPLSGVPAVCPVRPQTMMPILSPRKVIDALVLFHELPGEELGHNRIVLLSGVSPTVGEMVDALRRVAGDQVADLVEWELDPRIQAIIETWPQKLTGQRAEVLGFRPDASVDEIIRIYIEDELGGRIPG
jgi:nucleoside-diphosphate-sugar epimerase